jgi:hypothetical protein
VGLDLELLSKFTAYILCFCCYRGFSALLEARCNFKRVTQGNKFTNVRTGFFFVEMYHHQLLYLRKCELESRVLSTKIAASLAGISSAKASAYKMDEFLPFCKVAFPGFSL